MRSALPKDILPAPDKSADRSRRRIGTSEVAARIPCHPVTVQRLINNDESFPQPRKICGKNSWFEDEVDSWIAAQPLRPRKPSAA